MNVSQFQLGPCLVSFPRIDHSRGTVLCVVRHPAETVCAHIVTRPIDTDLLGDPELRRLIETWGGLPNWDLWKLANEFTRV